MAAADEADFLRRRRASLLRRIERVNATISQWHEIEANDALPEDLCPELRQPALPLKQCEALRQMLVKELGRLDSGTPER